ncbi:MAG: alpha/beta hydrolase [Myxococcota bacterium]|nr:alpha/beta fold hydrolase [Myxococcota bacterium]
MRRVEFTNRRGEKLVGVLHGEPNGRAIVSCHGMLSGKDGVKHMRLAHELERHDMPLLRFDFAGRGESEGDVFDMSYSNAIEDVDAAIDWLQKQGVTRVGLFGSSMGGAVALLTAARDERVVTVATIAAIGYPSAIAERYPDQARAFEVQGFVDSPAGRIGRGFMDDAVQHDVVSAVAIVRAPILVMHGTEDSVVPQTDALDIASAAQNATLDLVDGGDHQFHDQQMLRPAMRRIAEFLVAHL